ncbi:saccharopine dehydrogenase [Komagataeibacter xylinus]|uniref:Saccharopine dehydrogenase n=1 Tax=Komagataeibacter xylinus TaxID=28448 RepID=A0A318PKF2_KOMXY|nr:saccharopine dehydrogenase NADP-binding domain-containing protein [Komagataeibacter xylinus]AZV38123.1 saccharopine dehydrogenase [Komagataeibacter xylinus]PYD58054.1 saccharopine dehydrogenase [Komagataeibacter xylinus]GBQ67598.1 oxidoreductase [Komagataeibacter xylinus NBRC 15237]
MTKEIAVIGAGRIGSVIADMLADTGDYTVTLFDASSQIIAALQPLAGVMVQQLDITDDAMLAQALHGKFAVLSAAPFYLTARIAQVAVEAGVHYLDLTEDVASTGRVRALAQGARTALIPQCGLAPGFITIVTSWLAAQFDTLHDVSMRVGALPEYPSNMLNYNLTWSPDGVINEYCEPCDAIVDGVMRKVTPLENVQEFSMDGTRYEAFNTSGGLGSICEMLEGRVRNLNYLTIRYPGHAHLMKFLLRDLRLAERRDVMKDILEYAVPGTMQDKIIIFVTATGHKDGAFMQKSYASTIHGMDIGDRPRTAIQVTTAAGICTVLDMLAKGQIADAGFVYQENIKYESFINNRFGRVYAQG